MAYTFPTVIIDNVYAIKQSGAGGGTRTHTMSPSTDFESVTSANSITPAYILLSLRITDILYHNFSQKSSTPENFLGGFSCFFLAYSAGVSAFSMAEPAVVVSAELRMVHIT